MAKTKNQWVVIEGERYNLASMKRLDGINDNRWGQGIMLKGVYLQPRNKKVIIHTYSIWENPRTHGCYGDNYTVAMPEIIAELAKKTGNDDLMMLVPVAEESL